jgi:hypothetical protein
MFDVFYLGNKPGLFLHERSADSIQHACAQSRTRFFWIVDYLCDYTGFDFLWEPPPWQATQRHAWASQHQKDSGTYLVPRSGYQDTNYHPSPIITRLSHDQCWQRPDYLIEDFDWSWHPDPTEPPMIYQFGTQHQATGGPRYVVADGSTIKYMDRPRAAKISVDAHWLVPPNMNIAAFDWTWHPDDRDPPYRYQFPTQWNRAGGPEYQTPGAQHIKFVTVQQARMLPATDRWHIPPDIDINSFDFSWTPDPTEPPYVYQFGTQWQKTGGPTYTVPGGEEIKYINAPRARKIGRDDHWEIPSGADIESFGWTWHPDSTDAPYIYQFGTQHQRTGGPRYVIPGATEIKYVDQIRIKTQQVATAIIEIDHLDGNAGKITDTARTSRYFDNYLDTLRRIAKNIGTQHEFVWVCSSICDYTDFDFSWHPEQWQAGMLHVFPSGDQKFGDTFFMHVPTFQYRADTCQLLEWYDLNFITHTSVPRHAIPVIQHDDDSHVESIKTSSWSGPLALFTNRSVDQSLLPVVTLWREKTKTVVPLDVGGSAVIVPRAAVPYVKTQAYDYDYIDRSHTDTLKDQPLDIVFISNGEHGADHHWEILNQYVPTQQNRIYRVDGVNGRVAAYQAAARLSTTPWFFAVFAKLQVNADFDWSWQPDRLQQPKHYIFHAYNPVNHLIYGHQAMIAYNRSMTLTNTAQGLDFTLDQAHEVVPMLSGTAYYDNDPWMTWRTAFREALKLRHSLPDVENEYRLGEWLNKGEGVNGHWSMRGSQDAVEYYDRVNGDFDELRRSYEWSWLASYAIVIHPELFTQSKT